MNEKENKRSVPGAGGQNPAPRESLSMDSIEAPVDVLHGTVTQGADLPFVARSTGKYREGRGFSYYREGFDAYCFFVTVSGAGEITYRGETKRVERGDMVFVSSVLPALTRSLNDDWRSASSISRGSTADTLRAFGIGAALPSSAHGTRGTIPSCWTASPRSWGIPRLWES